MKKSKKKVSKKTGKKKVSKKTGKNKILLGKSVVENSGKISKFVSAVDASIAAVTAAEENVQTAMQKLLDALLEQGGSSFVHSKLGPVTIMSRNDRLFWRPKPQGRNPA